MRVAVLLIRMGESGWECEHLWDLNFLTPPLLGDVITRNGENGIHGKVVVVERRQCAPVENDGAQLQIVVANPETASAAYSYLRYF